MTIDRKGFLAIMLYLLAGFVVVDAIYFFALKEVFPIKPVENYSKYEDESDTSYNKMSGRRPTQRIVNMQNRRNIRNRRKWFNKVLVIEGIAYIAIGLVGGGLLLRKGKIEWKGKAVK
jgi:hypothetical protein